MLEVRGLDKSFPGVRALDDVGLRVEAGEVVAVVGENGAGKSTLMKILAGIQAPDGGEILWHGEPVTIAGVRHATALGIALIHQELNLCANLSVGANIFLGMEPRTGIRIDEAALRRRAVELLDRVGLRVGPEVLVDSLSIGQQQMVEIAKALAADATLLIMDEPTSSLSRTESHRLFEVIRDLRRRGTGVIYISHRLGEVQELADRVVVLRDGRNAGELPRDGIDHDAMVRLMVGREAANLYRHRPHRAGDPVLSVDGVRTTAHPGHPIHFEVRAGEIVGLAGLVGAGRSELLRALFGVDPMVGGRVLAGDATLVGHRPWDAVAAGMALAPEDRKGCGLVVEQTVLDNLRLARLHRDAGRLGRVGDRDFDAAAAGIAERLRIRTPDLGQQVGLLSGGNQQKIVLGKWLTLQPRILLLDEPTRGIDVGSKAEIYELIDELAAAGVAILFASSEMEEVIGMSDRVVVMHEGRVTGELCRDQFSEEAIMQLATGRVGAA